MRKLQSILRSIAIAIALFTSTEVHICAQAQPPYPKALTVLGLTDWICAFNPDLTLPVNQVIGLDCVSTPPPELFEPDWNSPKKLIAVATPNATPVGWSALTFEHLPLLKHAKMFQWASFSHPAVNSNDFYYPDPNARGYKVMIDVKGPGCLYHWWSTGSMVDSVGLKIYLDGATTPAISTTVGGFTRQMNGIFQVTGQYVSFVPIPFKSGCVVTTNFPAGKSCPQIWGCEEFFHCYVHTYPTAHGVTTYTGSEDQSAIQTIWSNVGTDPKGTAGNLTVQGQVAVPPGQSVTIYDRMGQESIASIKIDPTPSDAANMLTTRIRCYWDGSAIPQVDAPLSWFFGSADKGRNIISHAIPVGINASGYCYCYFPMPYWTSGKIVIQNTGSTGLSALKYEIQYKLASIVNYPKNQSGYFCTYFSQRDEQGMHLVLDTTGAGHIVGLVWKGKTGENDEMCWIDDNNTPQFWGTGGEDYPLFSFGMGTRSSQMCSGWNDWRWNRYNISDVIPFAKRIKFLWENGENGGEDRSVGALTRCLDRPDTATGWQSLCMYYRRSDPLLTLTDSLDVGNMVSESAHSYTATGATPTGDKTYEYQGDCNAWGADMTKRLLTDNGRIISGSSEFTVAILPDNNGVRLMRRMDQSKIQMARVLVDNQEVTESKFYTPINYRPGDAFYQVWDGKKYISQLFRDVEFEIPAVYTNGKSHIRIRIENMRPTMANGGDWSEFFYRVYSYKSSAMPTQ